MQSTIHSEQHLNSKNVLPTFMKRPTGEHTTNINLICAEKNIVPVLFKKNSQTPVSLPMDDTTRVRSCISHITDPLWKAICTDLLMMMGPWSVLKLWESTLGEFSSQDKTLKLECKTEEIAAFAHQYAFVILASLQRYFPALKQLTIKASS